MGQQASTIAGDIAELIEQNCSGSQPKYEDNFEGAQQKVVRVGISQKIGSDGRTDSDKMVKFYTLQQLLKEDLSGSIKRSGTKKYASAAGSIKMINQEGKEDDDKAMSMHEGSGEHMILCEVQKRISSSL